MDKIVLGLLMIKDMTGYEMRRYMKTHFTLMCSDSAGSLQTTLKKLLLEQLIQYVEFVENGKNKKVYSITDKGEAVFLAWESETMNHKKSKNIELSKLFFLGLLDQSKQIPLLKDYVNKLIAEKENLNFLEKETNRELAANKKLVQQSQKLIGYQLATLEYGIAAIEFEIHWYNQLIERLEKQ